MSHVNLTECVEIHWLDSMSVYGWKHIDDDRKAPDLRCKTIGWVLNDDEDSVTVTSSFSKYSVLSKITIPKASITAWWTVVLK